MTGTARANLSTRGVIAVLAGKREVVTNVIPFEHLYPGSCRVIYAIMIYRAYQFAFSASGTFFSIDYEDFLSHD
jgi:hypothetical protein